MSVLEKSKKSIENHLAEISTTAIIGAGSWAFYLAYPAIERAIAAYVPLELFPRVLLLSGLLNLVLLALWALSLRKSRSGLQLRYGIYWDKNKNPHCPACQKPVRYMPRGSSFGAGYYCSPCNDVIPLLDPSGKSIKPDDLFLD